MAHRDRASAVAGTAVGPQFVVAVAQHRPPPTLVDPVARLFLPRSGRLAADLVRGPAVGWMRTLSDRSLPGLWAGLLLRKRLAEDTVLAGVDAGIEQVVVLGSGRDTLAYRLPRLRQVSVYELDQPASVRAKAAAVRRALGAVPANVRLVPIDFDAQSVGPVLAGQGFDVGRPAVFVWEAVTQYLTTAAVEEVLAYLATAASGSRAFFTYIRSDFLDGTHRYGAEDAYRRFRAGPRPLWLHGWHPDEVEPQLARYGWGAVTQYGPAEYAERYPDALGPASEIERGVVAVRSSREQACVQLRGRH